MKKLLLLFITLIGTFSGFSQQAKGNLFTDVVTNKKYYVKQGAEITVSSLGQKQKTTLDSVSAYSIFTPDGKFNYSDIDFIKYKNIEKIDTWKKIFFKTLWISPVLIAIGYGLTFLGLTIAFVITIAGFLGVIMLIPLLFVYLFVACGQKVRLKRSNL